MRNRPIQKHVDIFDIFGNLLINKIVINNNRLDLIFKSTWNSCQFDNMYG